MLYYGAMRNHCRERKWSDLGGFQMLVTVKIVLQQRRQTRIMAPLQNDRLSSHNYHLYGIGNPKRRDNHSLMFLCISRGSVFPVDRVWQDRDEVYKQHCWKPQAPMSKWVSGAWKWWRKDIFQFQLKGFDEPSASGPVRVLMATEAKYVANSKRRALAGWLADAGSSWFMVQMKQL